VARPADLAACVALVMAGGLGTRMARTHGGVPKPLVPIGGIPLIEVVIRHLRSHGLRDLRIALGHAADGIAAHVRALPDLEPAELGVLVEDRPLGTIGALAGLRALGRTVLVVNGDLVSGIDLGAMFRFHGRERADLTIATHAESHRLRLGEVVAGPDHVVTDYREKPVKEYRISSGTYLVAPAVIGLMAEGEPLSFPELAHRAIGAGLRVVEFFHRAPWQDVNDADGVAAAARLLAADPGVFGIRPDRVRP
jgi:NDP-sugar pyrophosphorylase family protein